MFQTQDGRTNGKSNILSWVAHLKMLDYMSNEYKPKMFLDHILTRRIFQQDPAQLSTLSGRLSLAQLNPILLSQPNINHNFNSETNLTVVGLRLSNIWEPPNHRDSKLHDKSEIGNWKQEIRNWKRSMSVPKIDDSLMFLSIFFSKNGGRDLLKVEKIICEGSPPP